MKSPELFWNVVASYNQETRWVQILLVATGILLTLSLYRNPAAWKQRAMKLFLAGCYAWMAVAFFFTRDASPVGRFFAGPLFTAVTISFLLDLAHPRYSFHLPAPGWHRAGTLLWLALVLLYPLVSYLLGHRYPAITTPMMPCPLTVFAIALLSGSLPTASPLSYALLTVWGIAALPKVFGLFNVYEDAILFAAALYGIVVWIWLRSNRERVLHKPVP